VTIPAGGREGRHTHPGTLLVHVVEGVMTLDHEGRPTATYKVGDTVYIEPGRVHEGMNTGTTPMRAIASFVVEKGKPLTTAIQ
jgi:quercetin dioxygenase-like cupin family protein